MEGAAPLFPLEIKMELPEKVLLFDEASGMPLNFGSRDKLDTDWKSPRDDLALVPPDGDDPEAETEPPKELRCFVENKCKGSKRSRETPEEAARRRAVQAEKERMKRRRETAEEAKWRRAAHAASERRRRLTLPPIEAARRRALDAERKRRRREVMREKSLKLANQLQEQSQPASTRLPIGPDVGYFHYTRDRTSLLTSMNQPNNGSEPLESTIEPDDNPNPLYYKGTEPKITLVDICVCWTQLKEHYGCEVEACNSIGGHGFGLFVQDKLMKSQFEAYPEYLCVDATCMLLGVFVCLLVCEDSNGQSLVVALCLLERQTREVFAWLAATFQELNPSWTNTRILMTDPGIGHQDVLAEAFPNAKHLTSVVHTLRHCERRPGTVPNFDDAILYPKFFCGHFLDTENRLESVSSKIAAVCKGCSSLGAFFAYVFPLLDSLQDERKQSMDRMFAKKQTAIDDHNGDLCTFAAHLTNYALFHILEQVDLVAEVTLDEKDHNGTYRTLDDPTVTCSNKFCDCRFADSMRLPCRHILAVRQKEGRKLFHEEFCDRRWTVDYYRCKQ